MQMQIFHLNALNALLMTAAIAAIVAIVLRADALLGVSLLLAALCATCILASINKCWLMRLAIKYSRNWI